MDPLRAADRTLIRRRIQNEIDHERWAQIEQWGFDEHHSDPEEFVAIIRDRCEDAFAEEDPAQLRRRFIQLAAVAVAAAESMDEDAAMNAAILQS